MADKKPTGILAILAGKKPGGDGDGESGKEPKSAEARALKEMFESLQDGDWNEAASAFRDAYEACANGGGDDDEDEEGKDESEDDDEEA